MALNLLDVILTNVLPENLELQEPSKPLKSNLRPAASESIMSILMRKHQVKKVRFAMSDSTGHLTLKIRETKTGLPLDLVIRPTGDESI